MALMRLKDRRAACKDADAVLLPLDVPPQGLGRSFMASARVNCDGLIVTRPHKSQSPKHCTYLTAAARAVGCCNVVRFHKGSAMGYEHSGRPVCWGLDPTTRK